MALTKITKADLDAAIKNLTTSGATVWWKVLATTDEGTDLCFVVGWEYYDDEDDRFYQDKGYTICAKIGYKPRNLMVMDYDDIYMPFDKKTGDVWDTDSAIDKDHSNWDMLVRNYNSEASAIWRKYGKPNRDGMTALDLMESKKKEAKKHTCSMQKKKESLTKMQEMHPMFKNWNPRNQAQVNNTLRLAMAECPQDMPELIKIVKEKGFDVPSGLTPATGWGSFESRSKRQYKECSMSKKKESLAKKNESDNAAIISELETLRDITEANEIKSALRKLGFDIIEYGWLRSSEGPSGGEYTVWKNPNGVYVDLDYSLVKPDPDVDSWVDDEVLSYEYYTDKADYEKYHGYSPRESLKKKESLAKKNEADYGAMTWTVTVEFDDNGKSVRKDYVVKAHNRDSAIDQAKLKPRHTNPDAKDIKVTYCKLGESLAKKSEGFMEDLPYDAPVAIDALCAEIMLHTEEFTIEDAAVAEMCGKWYIRNYADGPTAAHNEEEWVEEVLTGLSGSPVDGSPFGAAEAEEYAHQVFQEELAEE